MTNQGFIGRLFLLAIAAAAIGYLFVRWWPTYNLRRLSGEIETSVNRALVASGIHDSQIVSQVHTERSKGLLVWVESRREIRLEDEEQREGLENRLRTIARKYFCSLHTHWGGSRHDDSVYEVGLWFFHFQKVVLLSVDKASRALSMPTAPSLSGSQLAIVIDDVAYDLQAMDHFAALGVPLTFAVLPRDRHTRELAEKAHQLHYPVILHLPMQPIDLAHNNPGGAALYLNMTPRMLHEQFEKDVASVPYIVGMNNHMGSAFTEDLSKMELVMRWVKQKKLFFLDSRTTGKSIVPKAAKEFGVPCLVNETFLDNSDTVDGIEHQLDLAAALARRYKHTIAIGHYRRKHLVEALNNRLPVFKSEGIELVFLPSLVPAR